MPAIPPITPVPPILPCIHKWIAGASFNPTKAHEGTPPATVAVFACTECGLIRSVNFQERSKYVHVNDLSNDGTLKSYWAGSENE